MSKVSGVPAMAHSPNYHIPQQRQYAASRQSPLASSVPVKPLPVADVIIASGQSVDEPHHPKSPLTSTSHVSYSRAVPSLSESSYTQPARLADVILAGSKHTETVHEHRSDRYGRRAASMQDQMPAHRSSRVQPANHMIYTYTREESLDERVESRDHALWILIWLSCFCTLFSVVTCLYAIGALVMTIILVPLHLCFQGRSYREQIVRSLAPSLNAQINFIRSREVITSYRAPMLVVVHLLSPFVSLGVAVAAWVAAGFWFFAAIIGDPDGTHGKDDGRAAVLGVRSWWEGWLMRASSSSVEDWA